MITTLADYDEFQEDFLVLENPGKPRILFTNFSSIFPFDGDGTIPCSPFESVNGTTITGTSLMRSLITCGGPPLVIVLAFYPPLPEFPPAGYPQPGNLLLGGGASISNLFQVRFCGATLFI